MFSGIPILKEHWTPEEIEDGLKANQFTMLSVLYSAILGNVQLSWGYDDEKDWFGKCWLELNGKQLTQPLEVRQYYQKKPANLMEELIYGLFYQEREYCVGQKRHLKKAYDDACRDYGCAKNRGRDVEVAKERLEECKKEYNKCLSFLGEETIYQARWRKKVEEKQETEKQNQNDSEARSKEYKRKNRLGGEVESLQYKLEKVQKELLEAGKSKEDMAKLKKEVKDTKKEIKAKLKEIDKANKNIAKYDKQIQKRNTKRSSQKGVAVDDSPF